MRGRPRHPDILTPRQWEVLQHLQRGLTNEEIAQTMGITLDGAKFHVSQILLRLGVDSRYEAATWQPEAATSRGRWSYALAPFVLLRRMKWGAASYAAAGVALAGAAIGIALLAWGVARGGGVKPSADAGTIGPANPDLIIYTTLAPAGAPATHQQWTASVYDSGAARITHAFEIGDGVSDQPVQVVASGDKLVANLSDRIVRYDIDGSHATVLRRASPGDANGGSPPRIIGIAASPDGMKVAFAEQTAAQCPTPVAGDGATPQLCLDYAGITRVAVIDTTSGAESLSVPQTAPGFAGYQGQAGVLVWRLDGKGFVVSGLTYSESPGSVATVMLDGSVELFTGQQSYALLSPSGLYAADEAVSLGCLTPQHEITITNVGGNSVTAHVSDPTLNVAPDEWAPDGSELLYHTGTLVDDPSQPGCAREDAQSERWYLLPVDGSAPSAIGGVLPAREAWYGARSIEFRCEGALVIESRVDPPCLDANGIDQPVEASINGVSIGSGLQWHTVQAIPTRQEGLR